jgi:hypothetical protein
VTHNSSIMRTVLRRFGSQAGALAAAYLKCYPVLETARFSTRVPDALRTFIPPTRMYIGSEGRAHEWNA